jgi:sec-independent protein translocase protein TatA
MHTIALVTPGPTEWVLILVIVLVLFGAKKLPELARSLGQSMNEFRKAREEFDKELRQAGQDIKGATLPPAQNTQAYQAPQPVQPVPAAQAAPAEAAQPATPAQQPTQPS